MTFLFDAAWGVASASQIPEVALLFPLAIIYLTNGLSVESLLLGLAGACFGFGLHDKPKNISRSEAIFALVSYAIGPLLLSERHFYAHVLMIALDVAFLEPMFEHAIMKRIVALLVMYLPFFFPRYALAGILFLGLMTYYKRWNK